MMSLSATNDAAASQYAPQANLISLVGQGLALLCWTAMVALSVAAWRRRRGNDFSDLLIAGGLWLAARLGTSAAGLPQSGQPGAGWLMLALDLGGLVLLAWPFLAPPLPFVWADRLAGIGLSAVALGCGISVWQWVRGTLGLPSTPQVTITWAYSTLALAGLAALHLLHKPAHRWAWGLTGAGALLLGTGVGSKAGCGARVKPNAEHHTYGDWPVPGAMQSTLRLRPHRYDGTGVRGIGRRL